MDNDPGSFIDELYLKFRQQVLDGNTAFSNYKLPLKSYFMKMFKSFLIDKTRTLDARLRRQLAAQEVLRKRGLVWDTPVESIVAAQDMTVEQDFLLEAILSIPSKPDREILRSVLIDGLPSRGESVRKTAKRALVLWAPYLLRKLGENRNRLSGVLQQQLTWYTKSITANFLRNILMCDVAAHKLGHNREWLADELCVSEKTLGKWARLEVFPKKETIEIVNNHIPRVKHTLNIPDIAGMLTEGMDYV